MGVIEEWSGGYAVERHQTGDVTAVTDTSGLRATEMMLCPNGEYSVLCSSLELKQIQTQLLNKLLGCEITPALGND